MTTAISCRNQAVRAGSRDGAHCHLHHRHEIRLAAQTHADALAARWRGVYRRAFVRAALRMIRDDTRHELHATQTVLPPGYDLASGQTL